MSLGRCRAIGRAALREHAAQNKKKRGRWELQRRGNYCHIFREKRAKTFQQDTHTLKRIHHGTPGVRRIVILPSAHQRQHQHDSSLLHVVTYQPSHSISLANCAIALSPILCYCHCCAPSPIPMPRILIQPVQSGLSRGKGPAVCQSRALPRRVLGGLCLAVGVCPHPFYLVVL